MPVPTVGIAPAEPLATAGRAVRPNRTVSDGSAAVRGCRSAYVGVHVKLNPISAPFVSAWLMANLYHPVEPSSVAVPPAAAKVPSIQRRTVQDTPDLMPPVVASMPWKVKCWPAVLRRYMA